jgi:hypothetical protein
MRIQNIRTDQLQNRKRVSATILWEDCDRGEQDIYFETDEEFADALSSNTNAFLAAAAPPALRQGERRICVEDEVCPELVQGLEAAMSWIHHWSPRDSKPPVIEAKLRDQMPDPRTPERAASFFTGGIDSLATLRNNHLNFPKDHPWFIKDTLLIFGLEVDQLQIFQKVLSSLSVVTEASGIALIPVYTNVRELNLDWHFWEFEWEGAVLSAVAHAFSRRLTVVSIASTYDIPNMHPLGSHPLLDPNYSSSDVRIRHDGITMSRLAKTKLVAEWEVGLQHIRVCNTTRDYHPVGINCGKCEKCVRTMLALLALGALDKTRAFQNKEVTPDLVLSTTGIYSDYMLSCYRELLAPLAEKDRPDLVKAVERKIAAFSGPVWKSAAKELDRRYLHGALLKMKRTVLQT